MGLPPQTPSRSVDDEIRQMVEQDDTIKQFSRLGGELLEQSNKPNVITVQQFMPYIELFNVDQTRYGPDKDLAYNRYIDGLYSSWRHELGINIHEVTYVIRNEDEGKPAKEQVVVCVLDRRFTRIESDTGKVTHNRQQIPSNFNRNATMTRHDAILDALVRDVEATNNTPDQIAFFTQLRKESAVANASFVRNNLTPDQQREKLGSSVEKTTIDPIGDDDIPTTLIDDDE